jgi:uncharacterized protein (DUF983 family)
MASELKGRDRWSWVFDTGWRGVCPRCEKGRMFSHWLTVAKTCDECGLDYDFAAPDDGPAFFSLCFVAFPLLFLIVWFEVAINPPWWVHILVSFPVMLVPCLLCLRPIKGWLVASQYINQAQEAGTGALWADLNARARGEADDAGKAEPKTPQGH